MIILKIINHVMNNTPSTTDSDLLYTPKIVGGRYELLELKGKGGMGAVYRGFDRELGRIVALKRILTSSTLSIHEIAMREARTLASLDHPNIISIYDIVHDAPQPNQRHENKHLWLVTAWLDGRSLKELPSPLHPLAVLGIMTQVMSALSAAHKAKIFHRDINPSNIMINKDGRVTLIDFGVASSPGISTGETIAGTLKYIDPRILEGKPADVLSDLFSAALVTIELLTGKSVLPDLAPLPLYHFLKNDLSKRVTELCEGCYPPLKKFAKTYLCDQSAYAHLGPNPKITEEAHNRLRDMFTKLSILNPDECVSLFLHENESSHADINREIFLPLEQEAKNALQTTSLSPRDKADWISFSSLHLNLLLDEQSSAQKSFSSSRISSIPTLLYRKRLFLGVVISFLVILATGTLYFKSKYKTPSPLTQNTSETDTKTATPLTIQPTSDEKKTLTIKNDTPKEAQISQVYFSANAWADLYINDAYMGRLPKAKPFSLKQGKYSVRLENPYMEPLNQILKIKQIPSEKFRFELKPKIVSHVLVLATPGNLFIDGVDYGMIEEKEVLLSHGMHHVKITRNGEAAVDVKKFFGPDTPKRVTFD